MSASTIISQAFGEDANLYTTVLGLEMAGESISASQLRKAYYRQALKYHPDKQQNKTPEEIEDARLKFEAVSVAYSILSDEDRRKVYDEDGEMDDNDELSGSNSDVWKDYFTGLFGKVTTEDIDKFTESYKCSEEEEQDVLKYYTQFQGDLGKMLECVMCSEDIDKQRWVEDYIKPAIEKRTVENYLDTVHKTLLSNPEDGAFDGNDDDTESEEDTATKKRKPASKNKDKTKPTTKSSKKKKDNGPSMDLIAAIQGRARGGAGNLIAELEARYSNNNGKKKKGKGSSKMMDDDPIPDDEFERIQKSLGKKKK